jgi:hypothetical protein
VTGAGSLRWDSSEGKDLVAVVDQRADARMALVLLKQVHVLLRDPRLGVEGPGAEATRASHDLMDLFVQRVRLVSRISQDAGPFRARPSKMRRTSSPASLNSLPVTMALTARPRSACDSVSAHKMIAALPIGPRSIEATQFRGQGC